MKYKSKPKIIDAYEFIGDGLEAMNWIGSFISPGEENPSFIRLGVGLIIKTLEGEMHVSDGDFIIRGLRGEFYPCKPDIFHKSYELIS